MCRRPGEKLSYESEGAQRCEKKRGVLEHRFVPLIGLGDPGRGDGEDESKEDRDTRLHKDDPVGMELQFDVLIV